MSMLEEIIKGLGIDKTVKGIVGELNVRMILKSLYDKKYFVMNNVLLNVNGTTSQVDHVVLSVYGIFVIETKNYAGKIYGMETNKNWKQFLYGNEISIHNPTRQNYGHVKAIEDKLPDHLKNMRIVSIVVFPDSTEIKVTAKNTLVINNSDLLSVITSYNQKLCSYNDLYTIKYYIEQNDTSGIINNVKHVINVQTSIAIKHSTPPKINRISDDLHLMLCKTCGDLMEYHPKGRYGPYYSCKRCKKNVAESQKV